MPARSRVSAVLTRAAAATLALTAATVLLAPAPARAADVFVEVNPSTVEAGNQVGIRASCPDNKVKATVRSGAFGSVEAAPQFGFLTATVRISRTRSAATYTVRLVCADGSEATTRLYVVNRSRPTKGPATGFGGTADEGHGTLLIGGGLAALAVGLGLGVLTLRRRRAA
jgi:hypothetical protein